MKKKILFLIHAFNPGGAQKVLLNLVNAMDLNRYDITIKTVYKRHEMKAELAPGIKLTSINPFSSKRFSTWFGYLIRRIIPVTWTAKFLIGENFDYQVAFLEGEPTYLLSGSRLPKERKIAWVHVNLMKLFNCQGLYKSIEEHKEVYECYGKVVCVSEDSSRAYTERFGLKASVLYNLFDEKIINQKAALQVEKETVFKNKSELNILMVGNCRPEKGYERMFSVIKRLRDEGLAINLTVCGGGIDYDKLIKLKSQLKLDTCINMLGEIKNPYAYMSKSDLFVCSSYSEALSTVVIESLLVGLPILTTDIPSMHEILDDGKYGLIVENSEEGLYSGLKRIIESPELLLHYRSIMPNRKNFFSKENVLKQIDDLFKDTL